MEAKRYAIIEALGLQFRVGPEEEHLVPHIDGEPGSELTFDRVLLLSDGKDVTVGKPTVAGASVTAQLVGHQKGPKIEVSTFKRRKKIRRHIGYRSLLTRVKILDIRAGSR
jgi:large subunit ribosomal protein L21